MIERDFRKLSPEIQAEIQRIADRLSAADGDALYPVFEGFTLSEKEYKAYFVPQKDADGRMVYVFECLFY